MTRDDIIRAAQDVNTMQNENTVIKLQDNEVLRVTAEGEFIWNEHADDMIAFGDYSQYPALRHILKALREAERIKAENERLRKALHRISLASQNSMSSKDECGRIARAALQEQPR